ncbi:MAG: hypothetical protein HPY44_20995 [Armatimonadetes bacterium]|nr:hypothetical protein [Armatimonadota bacterium]
MSSAVNDLSGDSSPKRVALDGSHAQEPLRVWFWAAVIIGLLATGHAAFSPAILAHYADSPDSVDITRWAEKATVADIPLWWSGSWIQRSSPYFRPLSSMVFWFEYLAFGWNFQGHVVISWLLHGGICGLVFLLGLAWFPGRPGQRVASALLAVVLFNVRLGPQGPGWLPAPVAYGVVAWWPGQTDQWSLCFSLWALLNLDRWLVRDNSRGLRNAIVLWIVALLFKEMAVSLPLVAGLLAWYRKGRSAVSLRAIGIQSAPAAGLSWKLAVPGLLLVAGFLALRSLLVPGAWGPKVRTFDYFLSKAVWYAAELPRAIVIARGIWVVAIALFVAHCIYAYVRLPKRPAIVWPILVSVVGAGALAQWLYGNFAVITIPSELLAIARLTLFALGLMVLIHTHRGPTWPLLGMLAAIHVPVLHVQGPHYFYWPAAFWGLFNASLLLHVWQRSEDGTIRWAARAGKAPSPAGADAHACRDDTITQQKSGHEDE